MRDLIRRLAIGVHVAQILDAPAQHFCDLAGLTPCYIYIRLYVCPTTEHMSHVTRKPVFGVPKVEDLYYPCSESKGAGHMFSYCAADMRLCFRI